MYPQIYYLYIYYSWKIIQTNQFTFTDTVVNTCIYKQKTPKSVHTHHQIPVKNDIDIVN